MKQKLILAFLIFLSPVFVKGQETVVYDPSVKTVVFHDNSASNRAMPVFPLLVLGESKKIRISFDDLSAEYHRFTYTLELMDENFNAEESVFEHDYVESVSDEAWWRISRRASILPFPMFIIPWHSPTNT